MSRREFSLRAQFSSSGLERGAKTAWAKLSLQGSVFLLAVAQPGLLFEVAPETRLERRVLLAHYLEQTSYDAMVDGVTRPTPLRLELASKSELVVRDDIRQTSGGRPTELKRRFEEISGSVGVRSSVGQNNLQSASTGTSPLQGASVVYTWVPEEKDWGRYYDETELDESLLAALGQDLDALRFRPSAEVSVGESWTLAPEVLGDLLAPAGDLAIEFDSTEIGPFVRPLHVGIGARTHLGFEGRVEGDLKVTWTGSRRVEGVEYDVLSIEFEISSSADRSELYANNLTFEEFRAGMRVNDAQTQWSAKGKGELFLAESGYLALAKIEGTQAFSLRWSGVLPTAEAKKTPIVEESAFEGTLELNLTTSVLKDRK